MISPKFKSQIEEFLKKEEYELDWLISCIAQFRCSDAHLVQLLINYGNVLKLQNCQMYKTITGKHLELVGDYPHHVKALALASLLHNEVAMHHPDLIISILNTNSHISYDVLMDTIHPQAKPEHA